MQKYKFEKKYLIILSMCFLFLVSCVPNEFKSDGTEFVSKKEKKEDIYTRFEFAFDTAVKMEVFSGGSERILDDSIDIIKNIEERMSFYSKTGELNFINTSPSDVELEISNELFEILNVAQDVYISSNGKFDVAIGEITQLWREYANEKMIPNEQKINELIKEQGFNNFILMNHHIIKTNPHVKIDLGGIAKGYAADLVSRFLQESGVTKALLNFGGNLVLLNSENNDSFSIGIQDPFNAKNMYFAILKVNNASVVTSGDYERYYEVDGKKYHHIIDVDTGFPVDNGLTSVTVVAKSSAYADAYSTAFFSLGLSEGLRLANSLDDVDVYFVTKNKKVYCSKNAIKNIELIDNRYKLVEFEENK